MNKIKLTLDNIDEEIQEIDYGDIVFYDGVEGVAEWSDAFGVSVDGMDLRFIVGHCVNVYYVERT